MRISKFFAATLAVTTLFASCSKEDNNNTGGEDRTVEIKIDYAGTVESRATGAQVADNTPVTICSLPIPAMR